MLQIDGAPWPAFTNVTAVLVCAKMQMQNVEDNSRPTTR